MPINGTSIGSRNSPFGVGLIFPIFSAMLSRMSPRIVVVVVVIVVVAAVDEDEDDDDDEGTCFGLKPLIALLFTELELGCGGGELPKLPIALTAPSKSAVVAAATAAAADKAPPP